MNNKYKGSIAFSKIKVINCIHINIARRAYQNICLLSYFSIFLVVIMFLTGCEGKQPNEQLSETRLLFDTYCTITIHGDVDQGMLDEAFILCEEYDALFSITIEGSDIWRINHAGGEPVSVDSRTIDIIRAGLLFSELSNGMFDITIGRLSRLWDFGGEHSLSGGEPHLPSEEEINNALKTIDYTKVIITDDTVQLLNPETWIDLGAIAKGYIAYQTAMFLVAKDISGVLIDLGGDVVAAGSRYDGDPWRIAIREPYKNYNDWIGVVEVKWASVLSSGIYERQFEINGVRYHHILDPNTGFPVHSDIVSATVITETAVLGEGLSTIAVLVGNEKAQEIFNRFSGFIGAIMVLESGEVLQIGNVELIN